MSNDVVQFNPAQVPSYVQKGEVSALAKALAGGGAGFGKRLSIKGGVFRRIESGTEVAALEERFLDVVIVAAAPKVGRTWYARAFSEDANQGPACWSADGVKPDPTSAQMQSETCAECPQNVKGSGQGDTRACRFSRRLAVVQAGEIDGDVLQLSLPAKSIFGEPEEDKMPLQAYAKWLIAQGIQPNQVITRMRFDTREQSPKLFFKPVRWLTKEEFEVVKKQGASKDAQDAITMTVSQVNNDAPFVAEKEVHEAEVSVEPEQQALAQSNVPNDGAAAAIPIKRGRGRPPKNATNTGASGGNGKAAAERTEQQVAEPTLRTKPEPVQMPKSPALAEVLTHWDTDD